jgi:hypothetical protein
VSDEIPSRSVPDAVARRRSRAALGRPLAKPTLDIARVLIYKRRT